MRYPSVKDMHSVNSLSYSADTVPKLWKHSTSYLAGSYKIICFRACQTADKRCLIIYILVYSFYICKEGQLLSSYGLSYSACSIICIDIIGIKIIIKTNRCDDRKIISVKKIIEYLRINLIYIAYKSYILAIRIFFLNM